MMAKDDPETWTQCAHRVRTEHDAEPVVPDGIPSAGRKPQRQGPAWDTDVRGGLGIRQLAGSPTRQLGPPQDTDPSRTMLLFPVHVLGLVSGGGVWAEPVTPVQLPSGRRGQIPKARMPPPT